jgi:DNA modification methylase
MRFIPSRSWVRLFHGDCYTVLDQFDDDSIDALVTDPPAGISFMGKAWDHHRGGRDQWIAWIAQRFKECRRVLKPGAHGLVWAIPRTSHWTAFALEYAGFNVRDVITHHFGSGFPKSLNIGEGRGTALKPASEHWILVRKPFAGTLMKNVLRHGTGGLNIDKCRIETAENLNGGAYAKDGQERYDGYENWRFKREGSAGEYQQPTGRWPANLILSGDAIAELDRQSDGVSRFFYCPKPSRREREEGLDDVVVQQRDDSRKEGNPGGDNPRNRGVKPVKNHHPTVKSIALMRYLTRLITPPRGTVIDPFMGSGSTGCACALENFDFVGMDSELDYVALARARIDYWRLRAKAHKR